MEKMPDDEFPACTGVFATRHVRPRSVERKTRARAPPPVAIQTFDVPRTATQVPLAANAASPGRTLGMLLGGTRLQVVPPSAVVRTNSLPPTGSLIAMPCFASQNEIASRKTPACVVSNCRDHRIPSSVRKFSAFPLWARPADITQA